MVLEIPWRPLWETVLWEAARGVGSRLVSGAGASEKAAGCPQCPACAQCPDCVLKAPEADHTLALALLLFVAVGFVAGTGIGFLLGRATQVAGRSVQRAVLTERAAVEQRERAPRAPKDDRALLHAAQLR